MGNSGSQTAEVASGVGAGGVGHQWTQSYPRTSHKLLSPNKVLPEAAAPPRLRPTNNGEILYNGGTISGRQQQQKPTSAGRPVSRSSSTIASAAAAAAANRSRHHATMQAQLTRYGSVPDLTTTAQKPGRPIVRKKYKAPPPPVDTTSDNWEMTSNGEISDGPSRRLRLFKTRAETKRRPAPVPTHPGPPLAARKPPVMLADMQRSKSLPEFQAELQAATSRLRARDNQRQQRLQQQQQERSQPRDPPPEPARTFYFGMEQAPAARVAIDESSSNSEREDELEAARDGIALHLRPILPKKQLEVPRFSPAAAWKQLAAMDGEREPEGEEAPPSAAAEQRIVVCSSERWRQQQHVADDSGISGDGDSPTRNHYNLQQQQVSV